MNFLSANIFKSRLWSLPLIAFASTSGLLAACSPSPESQAASPAPTQPTNATKMPGMDHGMSMDLGPADADFDLRFIDAMTPHHQGAVVMAQEAQQKSDRPEIKKLAMDIIKAQDQEIAQMQQWRTTWYPKVGSTPMAYSPQMGHMMAMSAEQKQGMMMSQNLGTADANFDLRFINAMIPHHESAVVMGRDALSKSKRSEIKQLGQAIVTSQQAEIQQMQQWRQAWYKK